MNCDEIRDQLEAFALDVLDDEESHRVNAHLARCPECRQLVSAYGETVHALPLALAVASPLVPPPALKDRVVQALPTETRIGTTRVTRAPTTSTRTGVPDPTVPRPEQSRRLARRLMGRQARWWSPWAAAAVAGMMMLVLALSLTWGVRLSQALDRERALRDRVAAVMSQQQEIVLEVVDSTKTSKLALRPPGADSRAYGKLFTRQDMADVVVMAAWLPQPPAGQAYHLWVTANGRTRLAGVLPINDQGFGLLTFKDARNGPRYDAVELTLQPDGSTAPSASPVLRGLAVVGATPVTR